ncbi:hypothetical protein Dac01nite_14690 [Demequina activiva]|uniref:Uncharacterized protein n=1 Tax=Demequina activiva TaxID=1582364 RepID=A0A919UGD3_9MICO|nr:hypothetical protein Dac01nite_14690 [Demequina activiva]
MPLRRVESDHADAVVKGVACGDVGANDRRGARLAKDMVVSVSTDASVPGKISVPIAYSVSSPPGDP